MDYLIAQAAETAITSYTPPVITASVVIGGIVYVCKLLYDLLNKIIKEKDNQIAKLTEEKHSYLLRLEQLLEDKAALNKVLGELSAKVESLETRIKEIENARTTNKTT